MEEYKFCPHCGTKLEGDAKFCPHCGTKVDSSNTYEGSVDGQQSNYSSVQNSQPYYDSPSRRSSYSPENANLALVFGILAIVLGGVIWGILGLVYASKADPTDSKTKAGKILSIIGIVFWVILIVIYISILIAGLAKGSL
jgi:hypothetical protein